MRRHALAFIACSVAVAALPSAPERVFETSRGAFTDVERMFADVAMADVLFVGEESDNANAHRWELALLQGLARRRPAGVALGFEMFERDVQDPFDHFQMGHLDEAEFLKAARPRPNYATEYKPLVDFALGRGWLMFASNVPGALANEVATSGLDVLKATSAADAQWFAKDLACPAGVLPAECLRDETMGESVARTYVAAATAGPRPLVVHFNGAMHSDFSRGAAASAVRRLPGKRVVVLTILPVTNLDTAAPDMAERKRADYLIYTLEK